jgi:hypothetical protein
MVRKFTAVVLLAPALAFAGEVLLGTLIVSDGGTVSNRTTGWTAYACPSNTTGGCFVVQPLSKVSIQCNQAAYVITDLAGADAGTGVRLDADQFFQTSVNTNKTLTGHAYNSDGGTAGHAVTYTGGWVAAAPQSGASLSCRVWSRKGDE